MPIPEERRPGPSGSQEPIDEVRIEDLESAQPVETGKFISLGGDFAPEIVDLPPDGPSMRFVDGIIQLDKEALEAEMEGVTGWLVEGVRSGDEKVLEVYLRNLQGSEDEVTELRQRIEEAFRTRDPSHLRLDELHVNIVSASIAERNLIREGLRPELMRQPFYFRDKQNKVLSGEKDLDIVIARGEGRNGGEMKIIVGSKHGIDAIVVPQELAPDKFKPDLKKVEKDFSRDVITIPLKKAADGTKPTVGVIEVHKGPIDLLDLLAQQERLEESMRAREEAERRQRERDSYSPPPPTPRPGRWTGSSG